MVYEFLQQDPHAVLCQTKPEGIHVCTRSIVPIAVNGRVDGQTIRSGLPAGWTGWEITENVRGLTIEEEWTKNDERDWWGLAEVRSSESNLIVAPVEDIDHCTVDYDRNLVGSCHSIEHGTPVW